MLSLSVVVLVVAACGADESPNGAKGPRRAHNQLALFRVATGAAASVPSYDLVLVDASGSRRHVLVGESRDARIQPLLFDRPSWSPDGQRIVFTVDLDRSRGRLESRTDLFTIGGDGRGLRRLTRSGRASTPVWSPDGRTIAFARREPSGRLPFTASLESVSVDGGALRQLVRASDGEQDLPGSWSPDGSQLAFTRIRYEERTNGFARAIYLIDANGSRLRKLVDSASDPAWSPDGRRIAFASDRDENGRLSYGDRASFANELYVMKADGGGAERLTKTEALNEAAPSWSPDGRTIAYQRGRVIGNAEGTAVLAVRADGSCGHAIAADPTLRTWYARPAWRPGRTPRTSPC